MDDRLQRRLKSADPLAAGAGTTPDPARLDAIKEQIMQTEPAPARGAARPRALGLIGLAATSLAVVLVAGTVVHPQSKALAWDPSPTAASAGQRDAASKACSGAVPSAVLQGGDSPVLPPAGGSALAVIEQASGLVAPAAGGSTVSGAAGAQITVSTGQGDAGQPIPPAVPAELPPLVGLELHGTGAVAIFADAKTTAYCLLAKDGDGFSLAALIFPDLGNGASAVVGAVGAADGTSGMAAVSGGPDGIAVTALTAVYNDQKVGIIAGSVPGRAARVRIVGGPADGATATVTDGRFAMWAPQADLGTDAALEAIDADGAVVASIRLGAPVGGPGSVTATTAP